jgi:hypothetical protein
VAEPTRIEPTRPTDWQPAQTAETSQPEPPAPNQLLLRIGNLLLKRNNLKRLNLSHRSPSLCLPEVAPLDSFEIVKESVRFVEETAPELNYACPSPPPHREPVPRKGTGMLTMPVDQILGSARNELSRSRHPSRAGYLCKTYQEGRFLDEVIHDSVRRCIVTRWK